jgi:hypothetical protein
LDCASKKLAITRNFLRSVFQIILIGPPPGISAGGFGVGQR